MASFNNLPNETKFTILKFLKTIDSGSLWSCQRTSRLMRELSRSVIYNELEFPSSKKPLPKDDNGNTICGLNSNPNSSISICTKEEKELWFKDTKKLNINTHTRKQCNCFEDLSLNLDNLQILQIEYQESKWLSPDLTIHSDGDNDDDEDEYENRDINEVEVKDGVKFWDEDENADKNEYEYKYEHEYEYEFEYGYENEDEEEEEDMDIDIDDNDDDDENIAEDDTSSLKEQQFPTWMIPESCSLIESIPTNLKLEKLIIKNNFITHPFSQVLIPFQFLRIKKIIFNINHLNVNSCCFTRDSRYEKREWPLNPNIFNEENLKEIVFLFQNPSSLYKLKSINSNDNNDNNQYENLKLDYYEPRQIDNGGFEIISIFINRLSLNIKIQIVNAAFHKQGFKNESTWIQSSKFINRCKLRTYLDWDRQSIINRHNIDMNKEIVENKDLYQNDYINKRLNNVEFLSIQEYLNQENCLDEF